MANNRCTYQQMLTVSIPKAKLQDIVMYCDKDWDVNSFRVLIMLFTELDGWCPPKNNIRDPQNFKKIDVETIAGSLNISTKKVKKAVKLLLKEGIIEKGSTDAVTKGYRFTF